MAKRKNKLNVVEKPAPKDSTNHDLMEIPAIAKNAMGGTELMLKRLYDGKVPRELLEKFQIIPTRVTELKEDKYRVLWVHDLDVDPEVQRLGDQGWRRFHKIVFVSNWQAQRFIERFQIPWSHCAVLLNAITPIDVPVKEDKETIRLIYHTTPHRGLQILLPVFERLCQDHKNLHLDVYSSYKLYGWEARDEQFKAEFEFMDKHPNITNHGAVSQDEVRAALAKADIFAYPSIWSETSCLCLMEAMSAALTCVHPNLGALYETAANWTNMYNWNETPNDHAKLFFAMLDNAIKNARADVTDMRNKSQKAYVDAFYNWDVRATQWHALLNSIIETAPELGFSEKETVYSF